MSKGIPLPLFYWKRQFRVNSHVYTHCPVFFKEWAGVDYKQPRSANRMRHAQRHTKGLCAWCWYRFNYETEIAKARKQTAA